MVPSFVDSSCSFLTVVTVDYEYQAARAINEPVEMAHSFVRRRDSTIVARNDGLLIVELSLCVVNLAIANLDAHLLVPCQ